MATQEKDKELEGKQADCDITDANKRKKMVGSVKCCERSKWNSKTSTEFSEWWGQEPNYNMLRTDWKVKVRQKVKVTCVG